MDRFDAVIIGAGVVGLAIAARLSQRYTKVLVIDKNAHFGEETSSRNSEVIHAGIYYPKNSLKAQLCVQGKHALYQYCQERHIPHQKLGKFIVSHDEQEEAFLEKTISIAQQNGVDDLVWRSEQELTALEPALSATAALFSPSTGIIDVHSYMQSLVAQIEAQGGLFVANTEFVSASRTEKGFVLELLSVQEPIKVSTKLLINSGGLHSTKVAAAIEGMEKSLIPELHYCRGHYFSYSGKSPFSHLIYPIPETNGLGIHASLDIAGQLKFGPDTQYIDEIEYSVSEQLREKFYQAIKKYFPAVQYDKLQPDYSGVRPKLQGVGDGFCDFCIQKEAEHKLPGLINLFGIDSPGMTSSLAIANYVSEALIVE